MLQLLCRCQERINAAAPAEQQQLRRELQQFFRERSEAIEAAMQRLEQAEERAAEG